MSYNIISYLIYFTIITSIILKVGHMCYENGITYSKHFNVDENICKTINKILLIGYYLINIGYAIITISSWEAVETKEKIFESVASHLGYIILPLALLHYFNLIWITIYLNKMSNQNQ